MCALRMDPNNAYQVIFWHNLYIIIIIKLHIVTRLYLALLDILDFGGICLDLTGIGDLDFPGDLDSLVFDFIPLFLSSGSSSFNFWKVFVCII